MVAVIPAAGLGTRMSPICTVLPKALLPLLIKPIIDEIIEELAAAGISTIYVIVRNEHDLLKDYLERQKYFFKVDFFYLYQPQPLGLGHAILQAAPFIASDTFFFLALPDNYIVGADNVSAKLIDINNDNEVAICTIEKVDKEEISSKASLRYETSENQSIFIIKDIVDKPKLDVAPSLFTIAGRYVLPQSIFDSLRQVKPDSNGEIQFTEALSRFQSENRLLGYLIEGTRFDTGSEKGYAKAFLWAAHLKYKSDPNWIDWINKLIQSGHSSS